MSQTNLFTYRCQNMTFLSLIKKYINNKLIFGSDMLLKDLLPCL